jgi:hypothetical protein
MKLNQLITCLQALQASGFGDLEVFYRHGASGDCGPLSSAQVTDEVDECGPFDLEDGETYISIYAGN